MVTFRNSLVEALMKDVRSLKERATEYVRKCKDTLSKLLKRYDHVSEESVKNLEARADRAEHRIETLKNIVEGKDKQITQLQADKKDLAKQIDEAYGDGIVAARKGWLSVVKHFGLDKNKEFRDYVNDMAGENIIKNPDRYMGMDR